MSKHAASLSIVVIGALGCRNVPPMETKEIHPAIFAPAAPNASFGRLDWPHAIK